MGTASTVLCYIKNECLSTGLNASKECRLSALGRKGNYYNDFSTTSLPSLMLTSITLVILKNNCHRFVSCLNDVNIIHVQSINLWNMEYKGSTTVPLDAFLTKPICFWCNQHLQVHVFKQYYLPYIFYSAKNHSLSFTGNLIYINLFN